MRELSRKFASVVGQGVLVMMAGNLQVFFRNDVTMDKIQHRFMSYANFYGKKTRDMAYYTQESVLFEIPGTDFPIPLPYILTYREIQLSGVLK